MISVLHVVTAVILIAWLCTAVAWGVAGAAVASWGRMPLWVGALIGAALPILGVLGLTGLAVSKRRAGTGWQAHSGGAAGGGWAPAPVPESHPFQAQLSAGLPASDASSALPYGTVADQPDPFGLLPTPWVDSGRLPVPARDAGALRGSRSTRHRLAAVALALLLAISVLLIQFMDNWVRVGVADGVSFGLNAWDIGLGQMLVLSALEFGAFALVAWRWRTRWIGVLAVFAGTWWFLLWSVACLASGGMRELTRHTESVQQLRHAGLTAGPVWNALLGIALLMVGWGLVELTLEHREAAERR